MTALHLTIYIAYLILAMLYLTMRAMLCLFLRKRFDFSVELLGALIWPAAAIYWIVIAIADTHKYPRHWQ